MIGGGVFAAPLLFIIGYYVFTKPLPKIICLLLSLGWITTIIVISVIKSEWILAVFPAIIIIAWMILHPMLKEG